MTNIASENPLSRLSSERFSGVHDGTALGKCHISTQTVTEGSRHAVISHPCTLHCVKGPTNVQCALNAASMAMYGDTRLAPAQLGHA